MVTSSNTLTISIDINCLPIINAQALAGTSNNYNYVLCKWVYNGFDYYDTHATANSDCALYGSTFSLLGFNTAYLGTTYFNPLVKTYLNSVTCGSGRYKVFYLDLIKN
jgi:hypothetical protein